RLSSSFGRRSRVPHRRHHCLPWPPPRSRGTRRLLPSTQASNLAPSRDGPYLVGPRARNSRRQRSTSASHSFFAFGLAAIVVLHHSLTKLHAFDELTP